MRMEPRDTSGRKGLLGCSEVAEISASRPVNTSQTAAIMVFGHGEVNEVPNPSCLLRRIGLR